MALSKIDTAAIATDAIEAAQLKSDAIASGDLPTGSVLSVNRTSYDTAINPSSTVWSNSGLSITLTPKSSSSKFYLQGEIFWLDSSNSAGWQGGYYRFRRGSTVIFQPTYSLALGSHHNGNHMHRNIISYLDSPSTASQITYDIQLYNYSTTVYWHQGGGDSFLTIFEIAG